MSAPIGYDAIVAMVVVELVFAFGIGISCILFSFNLFRELYKDDSMEDELLAGNLPVRASFRASTVLKTPMPRVEQNSTDNNETVDFYRVSDMESPSVTSPLLSRNSNTDFTPPEREEDETPENTNLFSLLHMFFAYVKF